MTAAELRHPGLDDPGFIPIDACVHCGAIDDMCVSPGCVRWGIHFDKIQDRNCEDYR